MKSYNFLKSNRFKNTTNIMLNCNQCIFCNNISLIILKIHNFQYLKTNVTCRALKMWHDCALKMWHDCALKMWHHCALKMWHDCALKMCHDCALKMWQDCALKMWSWLCTKNVTRLCTKNEFLVLTYFAKWTW